MQSNLDPKDSAKSDLCLHRVPPYDQEFIAQLNRDHGTVWSTAVLEIVVTTSQSDDRSRAVATEKLVPRSMVDCTTEAIQYQTTRFLSLEASKSSHVLLDVKYAEALYTVVQLAMHICPTVPNSFEPFFLQHFTLFLRRSDHRCHRIRASSSGIATPAQCGITRAV